MGAPCVSSFAASVSIPPMSLIFSTLEIHRGIHKPLSQTLLLGYPGWTTYVTAFLFAHHLNLDANLKIQDSCEIWNTGTWWLLLGRFDLEKGVTLKWLGTRLQEMKHVGNCFCQGETLLFIQVKKIWSLCSQVTVSQIPTLQFVLIKWHTSVAQPGDFLGSNDANVTGTLALHRGY